MDDMLERVMNPISTAELERRWAAVRKSMAERRIDVLYMYGTNEWSGGYLKWFVDSMPGNGSFLSVIFPREDEMTVIVPGGFDGDRRLPPGGSSTMRGVKRVMSAPHFLPATFSEGLLRDTTEKALAEFGGATIGLVGPGMMSYTVVDQLKNGKLGNSKFVDATDLVDEIMVIKSEEEIAGIRRSAALQDKAMAAVIAQVKPGMRDIEAVAIAENVTRLGGSETGLLLGASAPLGKGVMMQPKHMQNRVIQKGDQYTLLVETAGPGGFFAELGRTFVLGKATQQMKDEVAIAIEAQSLTASMLKPGVSSAEIWHAHNAFLRSRGRSEEDRLYAHGQGYFLVERPLLRFDEPMILKKNMNFAVHPMFVQDGNFTWMCDNFIIGENGAEHIHKSPHQIIEVD